MDGQGKLNNLMYLDPREISPMEAYLVNGGYGASSPSHHHQVHHPYTYIPILQKKVHIYSYSHLKNLPSNTPSDTLLHTTH